MEIKLPYGLKNDKITTIDEVESGLQCNCFCPACKGRLIARKGIEKQHHFAHYKSEDCAKGLETILHILAKEFISKSNSFTTPKLLWTNSTYVIFDETKISIDNVKLEYRLDKIIPDIIIESKKKELLVEITVTHELIYPKTAYIKEKQFACVEIFAKHLLSDMYKRKDYFLKDLNFQNEIINGSKFKRWIYNNKLEKIKKELKLNYAYKKERKTIKFEHDYLNYIENCPASKKQWKSGIKIGQSYAAINIDCPNCEFCVGFDYEDWVDPNLEFHVHSYPIAVFCCGEYNSDFYDLIKQLR